MLPPAPINVERPCPEMCDRLYKKPGNPRWLPYHSCPLGLEAVPNAVRFVIARVFSFFHGEKKQPRLFFPFFVGVCVLFAGVGEKKMDLQHETECCRSAYADFVQDGDALGCAALLQSVAVDVRLHQRRDAVPHAHVAQFVAEQAPKIAVLAERLGEPHDAIVQLRHVFQALRNHMASRGTDMVLDSERLLPLCYPAAAATHNSTARRWYALAFVVGVSLGAWGTHCLTTAVMRWG